MDALTTTPKPAARKLERALREKILSLPAGTCLGSESELMVAYGISRPTLRQVARILEHQQLLEIRAGRNGGFFASRPNENGVVEAAALYLRLGQVSIAQTLVAAKGLALEAIRFAARAQDESLRAALRAARDEIALEEPNLPPGCFHDRIKRLNGAILQLSGNLALDLLFQAAYRFGSEEWRIRLVEEDDERVARIRRERVQIADAILAHDEQVAMLLYARHMDSLIEWLTRTEEGRKASV